MGLLVQKEQVGRATGYAKPGCQQLHRLMVSELGGEPNQLFQLSGLGVGDEAPTRISDAEGELSALPESVPNGLRADAQQETLTEVFADHNVEEACRIENPLKVSVGLLVTTIVVKLLLDTLDVGGVDVDE